MDKILVIFLLIASAWSLSFGLPSIEVNPIKPICNAATINPIAAARIVDNLKRLFTAGTAHQKFPLSVVYINEQSSQLLTGGFFCRNFFNHLVTPFRHDLQNNQQNIQNVREELMQFIKNNFPQIIGQLA